MSTHKFPRVIYLVSCAEQYGCLPVFRFTQEEAEESCKLRHEATWRAYELRPTRTKREAMSVSKFETRAVLGAAYLPGSGRRHTHTVEVDLLGSEIRVLCGRVILANVADTYADDPKAPPTCPQCRRRDMRTFGSKDKTT